MKALLFLTIITTTIFATGAAWVSKGANDVIVTSYSYSSQAGIIP